MSEGAVGGSVSWRFAGAGVGLGVFLPGSRRSGGVVPDCGGDYVSAGGPIDAPDLMAGGSVLGYESSGGPLPFQRIAYRWGCGK